MRRKRSPAKRDMIALVEELGGAESAADAVGMKPGSLVAMSRPSGPEPRRTLLVALRGVLLRRRLLRAAEAHPGDWQALVALLVESE
jgi:hypothetical protein